MYYQHVFATFMQIVQAISVVIALGEQEVWHDVVTLEPRTQYYVYVFHFIAIDRNKHFTYCDYSAFILISNRV